MRPDQVVVDERFYHSDPWLLERLEVPRPGAHVLELPMERLDAEVVLWLAVGDDFVIQPQRFHRFLEGAADVLDPVVVPEPSLPRRSGVLLPGSDRGSCIFPSVAMSSMTVMANRIVMGTSTWNTPSGTNTGTRLPTSAIKSDLLSFVAQSIRA